ncbi:toxin-antitoxin system HicB family antitoxin [bacterium]|nr:toxin-antitoxin system HicB family antitoxin [bacterium]
MKPTIEALDSYPVELKKRSEDDGGGFEACYPHLGRISFSAHGKTQAEALKKLASVAESMLEEFRKQGLALPDPPSEPNYYFSGRFVVRLPQSLHARLSRESEQQGVSLNSYVVSILSDSARSPILAETLISLIEMQSKAIRSALNEFDFKYDPRHSGDLQEFTFDPNPNLMRGCNIYFRDAKAS